VSKSAALYPYCAELFPAVKYFNVLQNEYTLTKLFSPSGFGLIGKDAGYAVNQPNVGIVVEDALDMNDSSWEVLLVTDLFQKTNDVSKLYEHILSTAIDAGKTVVYLVNNLVKLISQKLWYRNNPMIAKIT